MGLLEEQLVDEWTAFHDEWTAFHGTTSRCTPRTHNACIHTTKLRCAIRDGRDLRENCYHNTLFHMYAAGCINNVTQLCMLLLDNGVDPYEYDEHGRTVIDCLYSRDNLSVIVELMDVGIDPFSHGRWPLRFTYSVDAGRRIPVPSQEPDATLDGIIHLNREKCTRRAQCEEVVLALDNGPGPDVARLCGEYVWHRSNAKELMHTLD